MSPRPSLPVFATALVAALVLLAGCERERERLLSEANTSDRPKLRASAIIKLGEMKREADLALFLKYTHDGNAMVRGAVATALGASGDNRAVDTLGELITDSDEEVQSAATKGLAAFNTDKSRAYLLNAYGRGSAATRAAIAAVTGSSLLADAVRHEAKSLWDRNLKALESGALAERVGACEELGRSGRGDAVERLLPLLGNDSILLAAGAARGLGQAGDRRAVASLAAVLKENYPALREAVAEALGHLGDAAVASPPLEKIALEGGPNAFAAVRALGLLAHADPARKALCNITAVSAAEIAAVSARLARERGGCPPEPIVARLSRGSTEARAGLSALENLGGKDGVVKVTALLDDPDFAVRIAAARALAELDAAGSEARVEKVLNAEAERIGVARAKWIKGPLPEVYSEDFAPSAADTGDDSDPTVASRKKFGDLMTKVDAANRAKAGPGLTPAVAAPAIEAVDDLVPDEEAFLAALALASGHLKIVTALPTLEKLAGDTNDRVRAAACESLGSLATEPGVAAAGKCLDDADPAVVRAASHGLARAGAPAIPVLLAGLDRRRSERSEILKALGELHAKEAAPKIVPLLGAGGLESIEAATALGRLGDKSVIPQLAAALKEPRTQARLEVVVALGELGDPSASAALGRELFHERSEIRAAAARALGRLGQGASATALDALRFDYYAEVRRAAEDSLGNKGAAQTQTSR